MTTLEERLNTLEQEVAGLKAMLAAPQRDKGDWQSTVGMFENDPLFQEAMRLGREYRTSQPPPEAREGA
jgi:hypothetical protein